MVTLIFWISTLSFFAGSSYNDYAIKQGYGLFEHNRGEMHCHAIDKEFDTIDKDGNIKCK